MDRILALDFDGVISDSSREAFVVAVRTHATLDPGSIPASHPLAGTAPVADHDFGADGLYRAFEAAMALGNRAEDFGVTLAALARGVELADQEAYDRVRTSWSTEELETWHRRFYEERARFREEDPEAWYGLQRPYPHLRELLLQRGRCGRLAVLTAKDGHSVRLLLEAYGLLELFGEDRILDKETGVRKVRHLEVLCERAGVEPGEVTFVDDKVNHLAATAPLGVRCVLAGWGHNTPREHRLAARLGFPVATVETAGELLLGKAAGGDGVAGGE